MEEYIMDYLSLFKAPAPVNIVGRVSTITYSFVNSIIPIINPTSEQVQEALEILNMDETSIQCSYCGDSKTEWDHLRPLVIDQRPTGYISEIYNLVPSCGKCNQSKGNKPWESWMLSDAKLSPKTREIENINERIKRLRAYERWGKPTKLDFEDVVGKDKWDKHWENWKALQLSMRAAQELASEINSMVSKSINR